MVIPVIDMSKLHGEERAETMAKIGNGCEEWGFFQLVNHGIPVELLERVKKVCSECFTMEREEAFKESLVVKLVNDFEENGGGDGEKIVENADWEDVFVLLDDNEWPSKPQDFKETMREYRAELRKLGEKVMEIMDENLGLDKGYIKKVFDGSKGGEAFFGTKVSHYPPCPNPGLINGLRAHTDAGGVILLFQDDKVGGLQILKNNEWIDVEPMPNSIVINTGDQLEAITNGLYKSVWHRVLATPDGNRRSIASFYNPSLDATIAPATELLNTSGNAITSAAYPEFVFGDYMLVYGKQKFLPKEPRFQAVGSM